MPITSPVGSSKAEPGIAGTAVAPVVTAAMPAAFPPWTAVATDSTVPVDQMVASGWPLPLRAARAIIIVGWPAVIAPSSAKCGTGRSSATRSRAMSEPRSTATTSAETRSPPAVMAVTRRALDTASAVVATSPPTATATPQPWATPFPVDTSRATMDCWTGRAAAGTTLQHPVTELATDGGPAVACCMLLVPVPVLVRSRIPATTAAAAPKPTARVAACRRRPEP